MAGQSKEISFTENAGDVTVKVYGTRVEIRADGSVEVYTNKPIKLSPIANDDTKMAGPVEPKIGDKMSDGTVYAGVSPDTGKQMYVTPADAPLRMTFNDAVSHAKKLDAYGHMDWRLPSKTELNVLFKNCAAIGGFNLTGSDPSSWYWSGTPYGKWSAWGQRFSDGCRGNLDNVGHSSVRCVR